MVVLYTCSWFQGSPSHIQRLWRVDKSIAMNLACGMLLHVKHVSGLRPHLQAPG